MAAEHKALFQELVSESRQAAIRARTLLVRFLAFQIDKEQFLNQLHQIPVNDIYFRLWEEFGNVNSRAVTTCLEICQLINSLREEMDYQLQYYGLDSFRDDITQLDVSIRNLTRTKTTEED